MNQESNSLGGRMGTKSTEDEGLKVIMMMMTTDNMMIMMLTIDNCH